MSLSLPKGQAEAGLSIGLTPAQTMRSIQLPQALTAMLPALVGQLVVILKDTALGTAVLYPELLQAARDIGTGYSNTIPAYIFVAVIFILINYSLTVVAGRVERRLSRRGRGPRKGRAPATGGSVPTAVRRPRAADASRRHGIREGPRHQWCRGPSARCSPDWTRTNNLPVNSRLLCQLSYRGMLLRNHSKASAPSRNRVRRVAGDVPTSLRDAVRDPSEPHLGAQPGHPLGGLASHLRVAEVGALARDRLLQQGAAGEVLADHDAHRAAPGGAELVGEHDARLEPLAQGLLEQRGLRQAPAGQAPRGRPT